MFWAKMLYGRQKKTIPVPKFVVFYNGTEKQKERFTYKLSDMYEKSVNEPELELIVSVYNINEGMNDGLKNACKSLREYARAEAAEERIRELEAELAGKRAINNKQ